MNTAVVLSATGSGKSAVTATAWPGQVRALLIRVTLPDGTQQTVLVPQVYAKVKAGNLTGDGGLPGGGSVAFNAQKDITNSGTIDGREVTQLTGQTLTNSGYIDGNQVSLTARQDISNTGGTLRGDSQLTLQAEATRSGNSYKAGKKQEINEHVRQQGTEIASGGDTSLLAGRDLNSAATQVTAQQDITAAAGNNVTLTTATESDYFYKEETKTKKSFLKKKTTHTIEEESATRESGTLLSGNNVSVAAGSDLLVKGSQVVGDGSVVLNAGNDLNIEAATNTDSSWHFKETKKSGLMGTGGIGFTIGSSKSVQDRREKGITQSQSVSTVGSTSGDVSLTSGGQVKILGADLVAAKNLAINGDAVIIEPGHDRRTSDFKSEQKTSGLSLALSGAVGEAVNSAVATAQTAKNESDGRLVALQATKTALSGVQAALTAQQSQASGEPANMVGVSISLSTQKSKSHQHQASDTVNGTTLNAGKDLSVIATGGGSSVHSGDILIGGSQMKAAGDSTLTAARDILLTGAASSQQTSGNNSSSGGGVGVSIGAGNGGANMSVFANVNGAKGKEQGDGIRWSETTLDSGGRVAMNSGRDLTLAGAQVSGNRVTAEAGRNLTLSSQQYSDNYDSGQTSFGAGGSYGFGSMPVSGYVSLSRDKMRSRYNSVQEQSGIFAGDGGFDITTGNHTQLDGGVIASTAAADKNRLDTGTLGFSDIGNKADFSVSHSGVSAGLSSGASLGKQLLANGMANAAGTVLAGLGGSGHAEGTTQAAVAEGTIIIRDQASQEQDLAGLSRDTDHANGSIAPIFDKEKEQKRLQMAQMAGEIAGQMVSIVQTLGDVRGLEAAKNKGVTGTAKELRESAAYRTAQRDYGTGGKYQMVTQSVSGILSGLVGGNAMQAAAGGLNPWVAQVIRQQTTDENNHVNVAANAAAHAVWGAVAAQMSGGNAGAGAAGAFSGELAGRFIAEHLYGADSAEKVAGLSEEERHELSLMSTLAAGLAGGLAGNSTAATTTGAQAGKNAVENNSLNAQDEKKRQDAKWSLPYLEGEKKQQAEKLVSDLNAKDKAFDAALDSACKNLSSTACQGMRQELSAMAKSYDEQMDGQYVGTMRSVYADGAKQVDGQMWQYASADAKAQREADIGRIAENWDVSKETAASLYDGMAFVHTTAAIGGAAYGMKGSSSAAKGSSSVVEAEKAALDRISQNSKDTVNLNSKQNYSVLDQQAAKTNVIIEPDKLKYLFGEVNSSAHNTPRSTQLAQSMYRLGIPLDDAGAKLIMEHISQVPKTSGNIVNVYSNQFGKFEVRESMLMGPSGKAAKLETSFQIMDDGSRRFITTIPKDGKK